MRLAPHIKGIRKSKPISPTPGDIYISQTFSDVWIADRDMVVNGISIKKGQNVYLSLFGWISHSGVDVACPIGTPILAPCDGWIIESVEKETGYGLRISMLNKSEQYVHTFGHLSHSLFDEIPWNFGLRTKFVRQGQEIARSGNSGFSTGPHCHWDLFEYLNGIKQNINNGHGGRIDAWQFVKENYMEFFQVQNEKTIVVRNMNGKYYPIATGPELYQVVVKIFGLEGKVLDIVSRAEVDANFGGLATAGIVFPS